MSDRRKIELRPEPPHRQIDRIPPSLERWGIIVLVVIAVALAAAVMVFMPLLKK
ncbi:MAG: hypothetical protein HFJ87_04580 [Muribaculaceae bacterium]|nr:hypothetical protein [Muribaculaceae bacterium]